MYQSIIQKITTTLASVTRVKETFTTPKTKLDKFPCVFFKPTGFTNTFETQSENLQVFRFQMIVLVGAAGSTIETAFGTILPKVVDEIQDAFDAQWNGGTIEGHRVTVKLDSADDWQVSQEQDGLIAYAPLNLEVRLLKNI